MNSQFTQVIAVLRANLGSIPRRIWISLSMVVSVALVVSVLIGFLAMARGFEDALRNTGADDVAIVLGGGTSRELGSEIGSDEIRKLKSSNRIPGTSMEDGAPAPISRELVIPIDMTYGDEPQTKTVSLRGMDESGVKIRSVVTVVKGRAFRPGARELLVGERLARDFRGLSVGQEIRVGRSTWTVVGHFSAQGSVFESEMWTELSVAQANFDRLGEVQSLRFGLSGVEAAQDLQAFFDETATVPMRVIVEREYYSAQSARISRLIRLFGWPIAILMAIGATAGALNTMMSSVSDRKSEIATLRALGFSRISTFLGTWIEAVLLAAVGTILGALSSYSLLNGMQAATTGVNNARLGFALTVTPEIVVQAAFVALIIGAIGGGLPAINAIRQPIATSLRE